MTIERVFRVTALRDGSMKAYTASRVAAEELADIIRGNKGVPVIKPVPLSEVPLEDIEIVTDLIERWKQFQNNLQREKYVKDKKLQGKDRNRGRRNY